MKKQIWIIYTALLILAAGFITGCMHQTPVSKPGTTTTVIFIRHADKNDHGFLTPKGKNRAQALINAVETLDISAIYSPDLRRNLDTVRPLAKHLDIKITLTSRISYFSVDAIATEILDKHAGKVVLWVGNVSGNLQALYSRMGGQGSGPINYGEISVLTIPDQGEITENNLRFDP